MDLVALLAGGAIGVGLSLLIALLAFQRLRGESAELKLRLNALAERKEELEQQLQRREGELRAQQAAREALSETLSDARTRLATEEQRAARIPELQERVNKLEEQLATQQREHTALESRYAETRTTLAKEREAHGEKLQVLEEARQKLTEQFENLANKILEEKSQKFTEQNQKGLAVLLNPLKENIQNFQKQVADTYNNETRERASLKEQIRHLTELNQKVNAETVNLTKALKGQSQTQGAWGEMILEMVLEKSGLSQGREYSVQQSMTSEEGKRYRPDVVVHLPNGKDIVIDSKVSLTAYERFHAAEDETEQANALTEHVASIQNHVKELSRKAYHELEGVRSLDYVLLFMPIEGAFSSAVQQQADLVGQALEKNVVIVTPSTLLLALRTVENIWRYEDQNQNAQEIAKRAGRLFDKFVGFTEDLNKVGDLLGKAQQAHEDATKKLSTGRGNLVNQVNLLRTMGAKSNKALPDNLLTHEDEGGEENGEVADDGAEEQAPPQLESEEA